MTRLKALDAGTVLGIVFTLLGLVALVLGWRGTATTYHVQVQIPYLITGGIGGIALIVAGVTIVVVQHERKVRAAELAVLTRIAESLDRQAE